MADNSSETYGTEIAEGVADVASHVLGRKIIDSLRNNFTSVGKMRRGDFYMNQSREMLQMHMQLLDLDEQAAIRRKYIKAMEVKGRLEDSSDSGFQRFRLAMQYRRLSRDTFMVIERASNRAVDDNLMHQIDEAIHETGNPPSAPGALQSIPRNPFTDSHAVSTLSDVAIGDLGQVELETYQSEVTGAGPEGAAVFRFHRHDASTQHLVATFPPTVFSGDNTDRGRDAHACSTATNLIYWQVETNTISSVNASGIFGPPPVTEEAQ
ncbi:hypothetical protein BC826DRAFT_1175352 [Russula brevipes]|nr:hypothetical protein BC826DRAFT_1175352 [Russula brevipes]